MTGDVLHPGAVAALVTYRRVTVCLGNYLTVMNRCARRRSVIRFGADLNA